MSELGDAYVDLRRPVYVAGELDSIGYSVFGSPQTLEAAAGTDVALRMRPHTELFGGAPDDDEHFAKYFSEQLSAEGTGGVKVVCMDWQDGPGQPDYFRAMILGSTVLAGQEGEVVPIIDLRHHQMALQWLREGKPADGIDGQDVMALLVQAADVRLQSFRSWADETER